MKKAAVAALAFLSALPAVAAEHLFTGFDDIPTGSVAQAAGWSILPGSESRTAVVSAAWSYSGAAALDLPYSAVSNSAVSAAFTNLNVAYVGTNGPVVRFSARLWLDTSNTFYQIGLRNTNTGAFLSFQSLSGYGTVGFKFRDMVFVPMKAPGWSHIAVYYNMSNRHMALDYNHSNVLAWADTDSESGSGLACTQFHQFVVTRITNNVNTMGAMYVDDVRVETFPPHVLAWWRFEESGFFVVDRLGTVRPMARQGFADIERAPDDDRIFDGQSDFRNEGSRRRLIAGPARPAWASPRMTNWTCEAIFRFEPGENRMQFFAAGTDAGFNTNGTYVSLSYAEDTQTIGCNLRDADGGSSTLYESFNFGYLPADGAWHHVALVKSQNLLRAYVDYRPVDTNVLSATADGTYEIQSPMHVCIGRALNNGNTTGTNTQFDEVRFSSAALSPSQFLIGSAPRILRMVPDPAEGSVMMDLRGPANRVMTPQWASRPDGVWSNAAYQVSGGVYIPSIEAPMPPTNPGMIRILRAP